MKGRTCMIIIVVLTLLPLAAVAGQTDSPGDPTTTAGHMPTLEELYQYLTSGATPGTAEPFQEPFAGPGATMKTLQEIYEAFKDLIDQCNNPPATPATPADVRSGVTFFSTESSSWGPQIGTGTVANDSPAPVEKTGQTKCYDLSGTEISCTGTGQDGDHQAGVAWPNPRFTDNSDGTVTDNLTGLIWLKKANCGGSRNWSNALTFANSLYDGWIGDGSGGDCGLSDNSSAGDWRLPNVKELQSLIDYGRYNPALPGGHPFSGVQSDVYWSSATNEYYPRYAWVVNLHHGSLSLYAKSDDLYIWPVRGGQ